MWKWKFNSVFISIWLSEIHGTGRVKIEKLKKSKRSKLEKNITVVCNNYEEQHSGSLVYFSLRKLNSFKEYEVYIIIFSEESYLKKEIDLCSQRKKKQNLKSSYLCCFMGEKIWNSNVHLNIFFSYYVEIVFLDFKQKTRRFRRR